MKLFIAGENAAFEQLYERHKDALFSYFCRMVNQSIAEELHQEMFFKFIRSKNAYRFESSVRTWIWKIANNTLIDYWRSQNYKFEKMKVSDLEMESLTVEEIDSLEDSLELKASRQQLESCIDKLALPQKEIVVLHIYSELSYQEIAEMTNLSVGAIKSILFRAKDKILNCVLKEEKK